MADDAEQPSLTRQALTATAFVELVDTLVSDFDVIDVLTGLMSHSPKHSAMSPALRSCRTKRRESRPSARATCNTPCRAESRLNRQRG